MSPSPRIPITFMNNITRIHNRTVYYPVYILQGSIKCIVLLWIHTTRAPSSIGNSPHRMQGAIDAASDVDIRIALLTVADGDDYRKKDPLAVFARTVNAAVTCGTSGTAGGDGLDICVDRCERKPSWLDLRTPRKGACYALCSLAIAPCTEG